MPKERLELFLELFDEFIRLLREEKFSVTAGEFLTFRPVIERRIEDAKS